MASERTREIREWMTFGLSLLTLIGIPCGLLVLRNNRLEIREEWRNQLQFYVTADAFKSENAKLTEAVKAENAKLAAENANLRAEVIIINAKLDKIQIQLVRLTDAVKLRPDP